MSDFFIPVPDGAYRLGRTFYMPTKHGPVWAIALEDKYGLVLTAGVSVVLTFIFMRIWKLVCFIALTFPGSRTHRRYAALVTIWNSNDPLFAFRELAAYSVHYMGHSWGDFAYGLAYCVLAFIVFGSSISLGILGPTLLQIGNAAPARPSALFYPALPDSKDEIGEFQRLSLQAPENLRALASVELAKPAIRHRVNFNSKWTIEDYMDEDTNNENQNQNQAVLDLSYNYTLTGVDFGLQHGSDLRLVVKGSCRTEYNWIIPDHENITIQDRYLMWNITDMVENVPIDQYSIMNTPKLIFWTHPNLSKQNSESGNLSYAILITSAHRASVSPSSDPWYETEPRNSSGPSLNIETFWVKRNRPVLSCWEQNTWTYRGKSTTDVTKLKDMDGMNIKGVLLDLLVAVFSSIPVLATIGFSTGSAALKPGIGALYTNEADFIDASDSHVQDDLERLVFASFIKSKNAFVDTTMFDHQGSAKNIMGHSVAEPIPGAGDFVVQSSRIQTFSMVGLTVLLVVLIALVIIEFLLILLLGLHRAKTNSHKGRRSSISGMGASLAGSNESNTQDTTTTTTNNNNNKTKIQERDPLALFKALSASQLFRRIHEPDGGESRKEWTCTRQFPEPRQSSDGESEVEIEGCLQDECKGHIIRRPSRAFTGASVAVPDPKDG